MSDEKTEETMIRSRVSSAYTRVVGKDTLNVYNTKQTPGLPKKAYDKKWVVIRTNGRRNFVVASTDKKYPAIDVLRATEIELKAAAKKAAENNS